VISPRGLRHLEDPRGGGGGGGADVHKLPGSACARAKYCPPTGNHLDFDEHNVISNKTSAYEKYALPGTSFTRARFARRLLRSFVFSFFPPRACGASVDPVKRPQGGEKPYDRYTRVFIAELLRKFIVRRFRRPRLSGTRESHHSSRGVASRRRETIGKTCFA
jgi:hypothetical protein